MKQETPNHCIEYGFKKNSIGLVVTIALFVGSLWAQDARSAQPARLAALALPFGQRADWREWDSFLTNVVKKLGQDFSADQRDQLGPVAHSTA
jgi:hypothetical protein